MQGSGRKKWRLWQPQLPRRGRRRMPWTLRMEKSGKEGEESEEVELVEDMEGDSLDGVVPFLDGELASPTLKKPWSGELKTKTADDLLW